MIIEITGTSVRNKGAELMLQTVSERLKDANKVRLVVGRNFGSFSQRAQYGLELKLEIEKWGRSKIAHSLMPDSFRAMCGIVADEEVDAVVDAAGFAFGDQLPVATAQRFAAQCLRWRKQGKPIVLLSQALGPFQTTAAKEAFQTIVACADRVYARDVDSYEHAVSAVTDADDKIRMAPDITIGVVGQADPAKRVSQQDALLVPNARMLDKLPQETSKTYLPTMAKCARHLEERGYQPKILIHDDGEDDALVPGIFKELGREIPVIHESSPLKLKGLLAAAGLVVGSRFHALTGALSSGVPAVALGWSHKYPRLFETFGCPEMVGDMTELSRLPDQLELLINERDERASRLALKRGDLRLELDKMWSDVGDCLSLSVDDPQT